MTQMFPMESPTRETMKPTGTKIYQRDIQLIEKLAKLVNSSTIGIALFIADNLCKKTSCVHYHENCHVIK